MPTDEQLLAALNAWDPRFATDNLDDYAEEHQADMRAALEAVEALAEWQYRTVIGPEGYDPQPHGRLNAGKISVPEVLAMLRDDPRDVRLEGRTAPGPWIALEGETP